MFKLSLSQKAVFAAYWLVGTLRGATKKAAVLVGTICAAPFVGVGWLVSLGMPKD